MPLVSWLKAHTPTREKMEQHPWLRPFARTIGDPRIWQFNRRSVARGVALGLFFGLLIPVGQVIFAALFAVSMRANLAVAAACTLITNPLTFPPVFYVAYKLGSWVLQLEGQAPVFKLAEGASWHDNLSVVLAAAPMPIAFGLCLMAVTSAVLGYLICHLVWRFWVHRRMYDRRAAREDTPS